MPCAVGFGSRSARSLSRAPAASIVRPLRRRGPPTLVDTTQKKINGIKRHILVDTVGLVLVVVVHAANIQDRDGAKLVLFSWLSNYRRLSKHYE